MHRYFASKQLSLAALVAVVAHLGMFAMALN
jgi:hypothetical protein